MHHPEPSSQEVVGVQVCQLVMLRWVHGTKYVNKSGLNKRVFLLLFLREQD